MVKFLHTLNWTLVRSVGELQILTRASYAMLIVVPMLAGTWPAVRAIINSYDKTLEESATKLSEVTNKLEKQANSARNIIQAVTTTTGEGAMQMGATIGHSAAQIEDLARSVETELATLKQQAMLSPFLPASWALAFFAALAVTFGHAIYQTSAPQTVRRLTREDFVRNATQEYRENPTERALRNAIRLQHVIERGQISDGAHYQFNNALSQLEALEAGTPDEGRLRREIDFIGAAARVRYELISKEKPQLILPTLILYGIGLAIIAYIIVQQSLAVAEATGWLSGSGLSR
jgi:hypothetical protein